MLGSTHSDMAATVCFHLFTVNSCTLPLTQYRIKSAHNDCVKKERAVTVLDSKVSVALLILYNGVTSAAHF